MIWYSYFIKSWTLILKQPILSFYALVSQQLSARRHLLISVGHPLQHPHWLGSQLFLLTTETLDYNMYRIHFLINDQIRFPCAITVRYSCELFALIDAGNFHCINEWRPMLWWEAAWQRRQEQIWGLHSK